MTIQMKNKLEIKIKQSEKEKKAMNKEIRINLERTKEREAMSKEIRINLERTGREESRKTRIRNMNMKRLSMSPRKNEFHQSFPLLLHIYQIYELLFK
jgi:hypothetical protein